MSPIGWESVRDTAAYTTRVLAGEPAAGFREDVPPARHRAETIAFGLRTSRGVAADALAPGGEQVAAHTALGLLETTAAGRILLTRKGRLLADSVTEIFV